MLMSIWRQGALILLFITAVPALPTRPILKHHEPLEPSVHDGVGGGNDLNKALRELELDMHSLERILADERYDYFYPSTHGHAHKIVPSAASSRATVVHPGMELERATTQKEKEKRRTRVEAVKKMKASRLNLGQIKAAKYTWSEIIEAGYEKERIIDFLVAWSETSDAFGPTDHPKAENDEARITLAELGQAGYTAAQAKTAGYTVADLMAAEAEVHHPNLNKSPSGKEGRGTPSSSDAVMAPVYSLEEIKEGGYPSEEVFKAGFKKADWSGGRRHGVRYTLVDLKAAGFTAAQAKTADYTAKEAETAGYLEGELTEGCPDSCLYPMNEIEAAYSMEATHVEERVLEHYKHDMVDKLTDATLKTYWGGTLRFYEWAADPTWDHGRYVAEIESKLDTEKYTMSDDEWIAAYNGWPTTIDHMRTKFLENFIDLKGVDRKSFANVIANGQDLTLVQIAEMVIENVLIAARQEDNVKSIGLDLVQAYREIKTLPTYLGEGKMTGAFWTAAGAALDIAINVCVKSLIGDPTVVSVLFKKVGKMVYNEQVKKKVLKRLGRVGDSKWTASTKNLEFFADTSADKLLDRAKQKGADMVRNTKNNKIDTAAAAVMFGLGLVLPIGGLKGFWDAGFQATMSAEDWKKTKGFAIYSTFVTIQSMDASIRMLEKTGGGLPPHRWKKLKPYPGGKSSYFSKDYDMQYIIDRFNKRALKATQAAGAWMGKKTANYEAIPLLTPMAAFDDGTGEQVYDFSSVEDETSRKEEAIVADLKSKAKARYDELDKDNDGALTPKEFAENSVEDPFAEIRKDDPGMLPTGPLPGSSKARERPLLVKINLAAKLQRDLAEKEREEAASVQEFLTVDKNGDGALDYQEYEAEFVRFHLEWDVFTIDVD